MNRNRRLKWVSRLALCSAAAVLSMELLAASPDVATPAVTSTGGPTTLRKLTQDQLRNTVRDIFGADIKVESRLPPDPVSEGLAAVGTSTAGVSPTGAEYYSAFARGVADQVFDEAHRQRLVPCTPQADAAANDRCAARFVHDYAVQLFRRDVNADEVAARVALGRNAIGSNGNFYDALKFSLISLLESPEFLFRFEHVEGPSGAPVLTGASRAVRLSFLLWNGPPDAELLTAADRGDLGTPEGRRAQVKRMMASPKFERGVRAFFEDMLQFSAYNTLAKDPQIYPRFSQAVLQSSREEVLRTIVDQLVRRDGDYRDLFTSNMTELNRPLGFLYGVPVRSEHGWEPHQWSAADGRGGLLRMASFLALHAHEGQSSPTRRGLAVRELFLCQKIPPPPAGVDFSLVLNVHNDTFKTSRARLTAHMTNPSCAGCHKLMDPIGFALENYDGAGQFRADENGVPIDPHGELNGVPFSNAAELGAVLAKDPMVTRCLVSRLVSYALGRVPLRGERQWVAALDRSFATTGQLKRLIEDVAVSDAFYQIDPNTQPAAPAAAPVKVAALQTTDLKRTRR